jgi:hypothetical protein
MTQKIIAFIGASKSGKSTASKHLQTIHGYKRYRFAGTLKNMLHTLGLTWEQLDGSEKEIPSPLLGGATPRHAMQTIGTEWRDMIDTKLWTNVLEKEIITDQVAFVVIEDCRFHHEVAMIRRHGGEIWCIRRASVEPGIVQRWMSKLPWPIKTLAAFVLSIKPLHPSELYWMDIDADVTIFNNGSEQEFTETIEAILTDR